MIRKCMVIIFGYKLRINYSTGLTEGVGCRVPGAGAQIITWREPATVPVRTRDQNNKDRVFVDLCKDGGQSMSVSGRTGNVPAMTAEALLLLSDRAREGTRMCLSVIGPRTVSDGGRYPSTALF